MKILDRYVLKTFLSFFVVALLMVTMLFLVVSVLDSLNYLMIKQKAPFAKIVLYYFYQMPQTVYMVIPMAALFSALITLGIMAQRSELVAVQAAGQSGFRLARPMLLASLFLSFVMFWFGDLALPHANAESGKIQRQIKGKQQRTAIRESKIWFVSERKNRLPRLYRIRHFDRQTQTLEGFKLYELGDGFRLVKSVEAESGRYSEAAGWEFDGVTIREFPPGETPTVTHFPHQTIALKEKPKDLEVIQLLPQEMNSWELGKQVHLARRYGLDATEYRVELESRRSLPFSCLVLMLLGIPLALKSSRASSLARNLLFAALCGFAYYVVMAEGLALGRGGLIHPLLAAWAGNVIFILVAVRLLLRVNAPTAPA